jgi:hypothetical protein
MLEAVFVFALVTAAFEAIVLLKLPTRFRLRLLGCGWAVGVLHTCVILANLWIHFGTVTGTMTAVTAGLTTFATVPLVRHFCGFIKNKRYYPGVKRYALAEIE